MTSSPDSSRSGWVSTERSGHLRGRRNRDTAPELLLRRALHAAGARFRLQRRLVPGCCPDILLPRHRLAVFVDGDFWHGCPQHGRTRFNGVNAPLWADKIERNRRRDERATHLGELAGWKVIRVWECQVTADPVGTARQVLDESLAVDRRATPHGARGTPSI